MSKLNYYELLNAPANASYDQLKANYKQLILQCHPDKLNKDNSGIAGELITAVAATATADGQAAVDAANIDPNVVMSAAVAATASTSAPAAFVGERKFVAINEAWQTLKDPMKRQLYDAELMLTKFQTHNNIFECLTLNDMVKQKLYPTETAVAHTAETDSIANNEDERIAAQVEWCYTHSCRCGGQYTIDESALNEIFSDNNIDDSNKRSSSSNSSSNSNSGSKNTNTHNNSNNRHCDDNRQINSKTDGIGTCVDSEDYCDGKDYSDNNDEIVVECSECSLVIIVKRSATQK